MATPQQTPFTSWKLSSQEETQGSIFSQLQKQVLQNELSVAAEQIISLKFDPLNPVAIALDQAALQARVEFLQFILSRSEESELHLRRLATGDADLASDQ